MRQLLIQVPAGQGPNVLELAQSYRGTNLTCVSAHGPDEAQDLVYVHISNGKVGKLLDELESFEEMRVTIVPIGVLPLHPPHDQAAEQVIDVEERSEIEIVLSGLQSIGSWRGFLGYAAAAGVVVWVALYTNSIFLQIAAMLIAPFAGPAMNTALATARGDLTLLRQSVVRYFAAIGVTIGVAALLHWILGGNQASNDMVTVSKVPSVAAVLPLIAGAASALNLVQSERSSLVPGAATGALVAAALAPPAGVIGMAAVLGLWDMVTTGVFLLLLQLVGINLSGSILFRIYGISSQGIRYDRGRHRVFSTSLVLTLIAFAGLLYWQFSDPPSLQRSTKEAQASAAIQTLVDESELAGLVESNVRFTRPNIPNQDTLLITVYAQRRADAPLSTEQIQRELQAEIEQQIITQFNVTPLVDVSVFEAPNTSPAQSENESQP